MDDYYGSNEDFGGDSGGNWDYNYNPEEDNLAWNDVNSQYSPQAPQGGAAQYPMDQNISNVPAEGWNQTGTDWSQMGDYWNQTDNQQQMPNIGGMGGVDYSSGIDNSGLYAPAAQLGGSDANSIDLGKWGGKGLDLLGRVFGGAGAAGGAGGVSGSNAYLKTFMNLVAANQEKKSNQQMATQIPQQVQQFRQQASPFDANPTTLDPNSARFLAQNEYKKSVLNPYASNIVSDQVEQMRQIQARKDAAAGRRSNTAYSNPAMLAASADAAMKYQNQLGQQAGAGQFMGQSGLNELVQGLKYGAQGNSPYFSAAGYGANANNISGNPELAKLVAALSGKG